MVGFSVVAVLLNALGYADRAAAQCGPTSSDPANTACGEHALPQDTTGDQNSAFGLEALNSNTTGNSNTASGYLALNSNNGNYNTASGHSALRFNTTGDNNTASGSKALYSNTVGSSNTASGQGALEGNHNGSYNVANGVQALLHQTSGNYNVALGYQAGINLTTGSNDIDLGNIGVAAESNTIRIGNTSQKATFIAGISGVPITGTTVVVNGKGQLGVATSAERFKRNVSTMGNTSSALMKLRPVTFIYKNDPSNTRQYGLIAEEVRQVYPELVTYDAQGKLESVRYEQLIAMLLNELQKEHAHNALQAEQLAQQAVQLQRVSAQMVQAKAGYERTLKLMQEHLAAR
jgi:hypothetical protein